MNWQEIHRRSTAERVAFRVEAENMDALKRKLAALFRVGEAHIDELFNEGNPT